MRLLGVITARGGSKGIPKKNIKKLLGKPLIAWTIEAAINSGCFKEVIVSTEDEEIATIAKEHGASVPFMRPINLAGDETPGIEPVIHAINCLPDFDWVMLLQPTSPLRNAEDIQNMVALAKSEDCDSIVSVSKAKKHPNWMFYMDDARILTPIINNTPLITRRQDLNSVYVLNGALYMARTERLLSMHSFLGPKTIGFLMPDERAVDIDSQEDWDWVEFSMRKKMN